MFISPLLPVESIQQGLFDRLRLLEALFSRLDRPCYGFFAKNGLSIIQGSDDDLFVRVSGRSHNHRPYAVIKAELSFLGKFLVKGIDDFPAELPFVTLISSAWAEGF